MSRHNEPYYQNKQHIEPEPSISSTGTWLPVVAVLFFVSGIVCAYIWLTDGSQLKNADGSVTQISPPSSSTRTFMGYTSLTLIGLAVVTTIASTIEKNKFDKVYKTWLWKLPPDDRAAIIERNGMIKAASKISQGLSRSRSRNRRDGIGFMGAHISF